MKIKSPIKIATIAIAAAAICLTVNNVAASVLAGWDVNGQTSGGSSPFSASASDGNLTIGGLTKGSGLTGGTAANSWGGSPWNSADEPTAISASKFATFTIKANAGYKVSITNISKFYFNRSSTGPQNGMLQYSTNGTTFVDYATLSYPVLVGNTNIDLSGIAALQNVSASVTATFRLVNWGGGSSGTFYISNGISGSDFEVSGTVALAPTGFPPVITGISPTSVTTNAGSTVAFTVTATGDVASNYWYGIAGSITNLIPAATGTTLTLNNVLAATATNYFVILSNAVGSATSSVVSLMVIDPVIITQPVSQTNFVNTTANLSMGAAGTSLAYQWYQGTPGAAAPVNNGGRISGATSGTLVITSLNAGDAANYFVIVTNSYSSLTSSVVTLATISTGVLGEWDFNGTFNVNTPASAIGSGTASLLNGVVGSSAAGSEPDDHLNAANEGLVNNSWNTTTYPAATSSNKTAGVGFSISTLGVRNIKISYDARATGTATKYTRLQYTTNGTDFTDFPASTTFVNPSSFESESFDLTGLPGVRNNASFGFRVVAEFENTATYNSTNDAQYVGASGGSYNPTAGAIRFDIVTINADSITGSGTPPTISSFSNFTNTDLSPPTNINFTVGDAETAAGSLMVSAVSENQSALPNGGLSFSGSGASRILTVTPTPGSTGIAPVLVTVTDADGDSTTTSFYVTVIPGNHPPTISSIASTNILANTSITLAFTVGDDATLPNNLILAATSGNVTLLPTSNIILGGTGTSRTATIVPATNQIGVAPITITVTDDNPTLPKSSSVTFTVMVRPNTNVVLNDLFGYADGSLITNSGGFWQNHSGTPGQMQVASGQDTVNFNNSEDVNAALIGQPYKTNSPFVLYSSFTVNFSTLPTVAGSYFAHFKDTNSGAATGFGGRVWTSTTNAAPGAFRLGIGNGATATNTSGQFPMDLVLNSNYNIVTRFIPSNGVATIWINPSGESDPSGVTATDITNSPPNPINVASYALRENDGEGVMTIDYLKVGLTFDSVFPSLHIQPVGTNVVLNWSDPTLGIQSATNVTGPYVDISGATPPYTNNVNTNKALFFRFGQ
jgi:hypothetical protein